MVQLVARVRSRPAQIWPGVHHPRWQPSPKSVQRPLATSWLHFRLPSFSSSGDSRVTAAATMAMPKELTSLSTPEAILDLTATPTGGNHPSTAYMGAASKCHHATGSQRSENNGVAFRGSCSSASPSGSRRPTNSAVYRGSNGHCCCRARGMVVYSGSPVW